MISRTVMQAAFKRLRRRTAGWTTARGVLCISLVAYSVHRVGAYGIATVLANARPWWILAAVFLYGVCQIVSASRWASVLKAIGAPVRVTELFRYYLVGMVFNQFLPGSVGGDAARCILVKRKVGAATPALWI